MGWAEIFILLFVTIGPVRPTIAFYMMTASADARHRRALAVRAVGVAALITVIMALIGASLLQNWQVRIEALEIAGGVILFLSALQIVMGEDKPAAQAGPPPTPTLDMAVFPLAAPTIATPQGLVAIVAIEATLDRVQDSALLIGLILCMMAINLAFLLASPWIVSRIPPAALKVFVRVLGVLLAGLAVQFVLFGLEDLGVIPAPDTITTQ